MIFKKPSTLLITAICVCCAVMLYMSIGVEVIHREHTVDYEVFLKKHLTANFWFKNPVLCGECDFLPYDKLSLEESREKFKTLCTVRYDLTDVYECEKLFE